MSFLRETVPTTRNLPSAYDNSPHNALYSHVNDAHLASGQPVDLLMMQVRGTQGAVHFDFAVVTNESPLSEPIHNKIGSTAGGTYHIC